MNKNECNLVVYTEEKLKKTAYDNLVDMAEGIAKDMSVEDMEKLKKSPTAGTLKTILEK